MWQNADGTVNYVCEITRGTRRKMEIAIDEPLTPIKQVNPCLISFTVAGREEWQATRTRLRRHAVQLRSTPLGK